MVVVVERYEGRKRSGGRYIVVSIFVYVFYGN